VSSHRKLYLESIPLHDALTKWTKRLSAEGAMNPLPGERIKVIESLGRITSEAVSANISSPFYHASAMDGYAVRFEDTFGASERKPKRIKVREQARPVNTGDPIPEGFNAVIMIEDVNIIREEVPGDGDGDFPRITGFDRLISERCLQAGMKRSWSEGNLVW
jgi:putative molybdopterin biosynthesis protein